MTKFEISQFPKSDVHPNSCYAHRVDGMGRTQYFTNNARGVGPGVWRGWCGTEGLFDSENSLRQEIMLTEMLAAQSTHEQTAVPTPEHSLVPRDEYLAGMQHILDMLGSTKTYRLTAIDDGLMIARIITDVAIETHKAKGPK
jgi:hypothetical protein